MSETLEQREARYVAERAEREAEKQQRKDRLASGEWRLSTEELTTMLATLAPLLERPIESSWYADWQYGLLRNPDEFVYCETCGHEEEPTFTDEQQEAIDASDFYSRKVSTIKEGLRHAIWAIKEILKEEKRVRAWAEEKAWDLEQKQERKRAVASEKARVENMTPVELREEKARKKVEKMRKKEAFERAEQSLIEFGILPGGEE